MSRYCGTRMNPAPILDAAQLWRNKCLLDSESVFGFGDIWTQENVAQLVTHYVNNLDFSGSNFLSKMESQLRDASKESVILCADIQKSTDRERIYFESN